MAEADTDPPNTMEDEDLEDGEIETDEENDVPVNETKPAAKVASVDTTSAPAAAATVPEQAKKLKLSDDDLKKANDTKPKSDNRKSTQDISTKNKKLTANDVAKGEQPFHLSVRYFSLVPSFSALFCFFFCYR